MGALALRLTIDGDREDYADARQSDQLYFPPRNCLKQAKLYESDFMTCHAAGLPIVSGCTECKQGSISAGQVFDAPQ